MSLFTQNKEGKGNKFPSSEIKEMCIFAMLGAIMFISKIIMEMLPNIHLLGFLTITYTVVYRQKALIPIYIFVFLNGLFAGFSAWWLPYLYVWTLLWGATMLLPRNMPRGLACVVYPALCALHGFLFGVLYAPAQALIFGLNFRQTLAWIAAGFPFDLIHGVGNIFTGMLVLPLSSLLLKLKNRYS